MNKPVPPSDAGTPPTASPAPATATPSPVTALPAPAQSGASKRPDRQRQTPSTAPQAAAPPAATPAATGTLLIRATPSNAQVVVNGVTWPLGGDQRTVPAGTYTVRVSADGCEGVTRSITVDPGGSARLPVILTCQTP